ncbi:hypothetical protein OHS71_35245 [Streptomyces sp. NBC_00377]|uniref:hypothetical protein n=1 Tax=unclassified Streptomyces TaxID=2593676 RepID=UPI002E1DF4EA|nr:MULTISPECIES: hypothetical protein [unclassified Streptomyces]
MTRQPDGKKRGFSLPGFAFMLCSVAIAHCVTEVAFGRSVGSALGTLAEDAVTLVVVVAVVARVLAGRRRRSPG